MWQGSEYGNVTQGSKYATILLNMSGQDVIDANMPEHVRIQDNRQGSEYVSDNIQKEVTLQVNEHLLREAYSEPIQKI